MQNETGTLGALVLIFVCFMLYFMPTMNAKSRKHPNRSSIFLLNLLLGWTLVGWVIALVWSASAIAPIEPIRVKESEPAEQDKYQKLETLASLKERGMITDEEFQKEKAALLGS